MARQAEIRLSGTSYAVLGLVKYLGQATPYDLKRAIETSVENFWPVPHTTFYAEPERLAAAGYLSEQRENGGRRRKLYEITDRGRQALEAWVESEELNPPQLRDEATLKVFFGADPGRVYGARLGWHRAKLAELEGYLAGVSAALQTGRAIELGGGDPAALEGIRASLLAGTSYHRMQIEAIESGLGQGAARRSAGPVRRSG
jgi:DNA-binding PadR family transcriptional regulator